MRKTLLVTVLAAGYMLVGCGSADTRNRTATPEETRKAGADALNTRDVGEDKDLVGTDNENSPHKNDVKPQEQPKEKK